LNFSIAAGIIVLAAAMVFYLVEPIITYVLLAYLVFYSAFMLYTYRQTLKLPSHLPEIPTAEKGMPF
jgi:hypothetical protein